MAGEATNRGESEREEDARSAPEPVQAEALERQVEEEDFRLRLKLGGYAVMVAFGFLFLFMPMLAGIRMLIFSFPVVAWAFVNAPLVVVAILVARGWRIPVGGGRFLAGARAWRAIAGGAGLSLFLFFGRDLVAWLLDFIWPKSW